MTIYLIYAATTNNWLMFAGTQMIRNRMDMLIRVFDDGLLCPNQWQGIISTNSGYDALMNVYTVSLANSSSIVPVLSLLHLSMTAVE